MFQVPVSWGSVGAFQVSVYLASVVPKVLALQLPEARQNLRVSPASVQAAGGLSDRTRGPEPTGDNRGPNAPGVVATGGPQPTPGDVEVGSSQPIPLAQIGNVGVFGQGGDRVDEIKNDGTHTDFTVGPNFAGAGVVGRGGLQFVLHAITLAARGYKPACWAAVAGRRASFAHYQR